MVNDKVYVDQVTVAKGVSVNTGAGDNFVDLAIKSEVAAKGMKGTVNVNTGVGITCATSGQLRHLWRHSHPDVRKIERVQ